MVVVLHGADLDSLKIIQGFNTDISGHDTEILVCHGQKAHAAFLVDFIHFGHESLIVQDFMELVQVVEGAGQVEQAQTGQIADLRRRILNQEGDIAALD